jgi:hypothetical protein
VKIRPTANTSPPVPVRLLIGLHVCLGLPLLIAPGKVVGALPHQRIDRPVRVFARILGARHLAEAAVLARRHTHDWILAGAAVDATHALTMLLLAWLRPARRELALANVAGATLLAACSVHYDQRGRLAGAGYAEARG